MLNVAEHAMRAWEAITRVMAAPIKNCKVACSIMNALENQHTTHIIPLGNKHLSIYELAIQVSEVIKHSGPDTNFIPYSAVNQATSTLHKFKMEESLGQNLSASVSS